MLPVLHKYIHFLLKTKSSVYKFIPVVDTKSHMIYSAEMWQRAAVSAVLLSYLWWSCTSFLKICRPQNDLCVHSPRTGWILESHQQFVICRQNFNHSLAWNRLIGNCSASILRPWHIPTTVEAPIPMKGPSHRQSIRYKNFYQVGTNSGMAHVWVLSPKVRRNDSYGKH